MEVGEIISRPFSTMYQVLGQVPCSKTQRKPMNETVDCSLKIWPLFSLFFYENIRVSNNMVEKSSKIIKFLLNTSLNIKNCTGLVFYKC